MEKRILQNIEQLVSIKSVKSNNKALYEAVDWVRYYFNDSQVIIRSYESNGKPSIVLLTEDTKHPKILLNGHLDVVEADPGMFTLSHAGDILRGRGVFDMKGPDAVMIEIFKKLANEKEGLSMGLMLTTDEEIGGANGVRYLMQDEGYTSDIVYIPDGGNDFNVLIEEKGIMHVKLVAHGKAAHGARPWLGENANEKLIRVYLDLKKHFPDPKDEVEWKPSLNLGTFNGGETTNKVSDYAEMNLDFRYPYTVPVSQFESLLQSVCHSVDGVSYEVLVSGNVAYVDKDNTYVKMYQDIVQKITGSQSEVSRSAGASDARYFSDEDIPFIISRPPGGDHHTPDEWISVDGLMKSAQILDELILAVH